MNIFAESVYDRILHHPSRVDLINLFELEAPGKDVEGIRVWQHYAQFIALKIFSGDFELSRLEPSDEIDKMWQLHILDTYGYAEFCKDVFPPLGPIIHRDHHRKFLSRQEIEEGRNRTKKIYEYVFKEECLFFHGKDQYKHQSILRPPTHF